MKVYCNQCGLIDKATDWQYAMTVAKNHLKKFHKRSVFGYQIREIPSRFGIRFERENHGSSNKV